MRLLIFLFFSQFGLTCKYGIIGYKFAFSNAWCNNFQSDKSVTETLFYLFFKQNMFLVGLFLKLVLC